MNIQAILTGVSFAPNGIGMEWAWETRLVAGEAEAQDARGHLLRVSFKRPDRDTGEVTRGYGRWWFVAHDTSESGVVKTCFAACRMILEHELMEAFRYDGARVFDPHNSVEQLASLQVGR